MSHVVSLADVSLQDVAIVGGKNASLGELIRHLRKAGVRVAPGFATTVAAYKAFIAANGLEGTIRETIGRNRKILGDAVAKDYEEKFRLEDSELPLLER